MLPLLIGLGSWQVERLHWKEELVATIIARIHQDPVDIASLAVDEADYHPATGSGTFLNDKSFYLLAISLTGEGGYHVLTPLHLEDGQFLLVDRGWIPYDMRGKNYARPSDVVRIAGVARIPQYHRIRSQNDPEGNNWYQIDMDMMATRAGVPAFLPYILEADAAPNEGGYPVGGQTRLTLPNNHLSYAVTWYGLALVLIVIYSLSSYRKNAAHLKAPKTEA